MKLEIKFFFLIFLLVVLLSGNMLKTPLRAHRALRCIPLEIFEGRRARPLAHRPANGQLRTAALATRGAGPGITVTMADAASTAWGSKDMLLTAFVVGHGPRGAAEDGVIGWRGHVDWTRSREKVFQRIKPHIVALLGRASDLHLSVGRGNNNTVLVQARRHRVRVEDRPHALNVRTLRATLRDPTAPWIRRAPIQGLGIWMNPEEPLVPRLPMTLSNRLACILPQKLANHRLGNRVDDIRVGGLHVRVGFGRGVGYMRTLGGSRALHVGRDEGVDIRRDGGAWRG